MKPTDSESSSSYAPSHRVAVLDGEMAYVDVGHGEPVVFLHGNPTSSYMWRHILPSVESSRCLAPDLIGMGASAPSPRRAYRFSDHSAYLDAWFDTLQLGNVILVMHDWGVPLGVYWARRFPQRVAGLAYMEGQVRPRHWSDLPPGRDKFFRALRGPEGERLALDENFFLEKMFFGDVLTPLSEADKNAYRAPYAEDRESRWPTLVWPREIPFDGEPADTHAVISDNGEWLAASTLPKLFVNAEPGNSIAGETRDFCRRFANQREITVPGRHYVPEDAPQAIGAALNAFVRDIRRAPA